MLKKILNQFHDFRDRQKIAIALSKGAAMMLSRNIDLRNPSTWEFSGFSQNGEDGIIDVLRSQLLDKNRYFLEIGVGDGLENNTAWLLIAEKYNGIMVDGNKNLINRARRSILGHSIGSQVINAFVTPKTVSDVFAKSLYKNPDVLSLDIDGIDYYIAEQIFNLGFRPKICVVEYNAVFGKNKSLTVNYEEHFDKDLSHPTSLYYGVSIQGWKNFFEDRGYNFVTVDTHGVNAVFVDPTVFSNDFISEITGLHFAENLFQQMKFDSDSYEQFTKIENQKFVTI